MINEPANLKRIFDKLGSEWARDEHKKVWDWILQDCQLQDCQLRYLLYFAKQHLGSNTTREDAEDVCFSVLERFFTIDYLKYNPEKSRFLNYLLFCLARACHKRGDQIRKRENNQEDANSLELELVDPNERPDETLIKKEEAEIVRECMNELRPDHRVVLEMRCIEEMAVKEMAKVLKISKNHVNVRLCRARQELKQIFLKKYPDIF